MSDECRVSRVESRLTPVLSGAEGNHDSRFSEKPLQEYDVEPSVKLAADLPEVRDAGKPRRLEESDDGRRLAAASADERVMSEVTGARDQVAQNGAADAAAVPLGVDVDGELGGMPVRGAAAEHFERSPAHDRAVNLRDDDRVSLGPVLEPGQALLQRQRIGEEGRRGMHHVVVLDGVDGLGIASIREANRTGAHALNRRRRAR